MPISDPLCQEALFLSEISETHMLPIGSQWFGSPEMALGDRWLIEGDTSLTSSKVRAVNGFMHRGLEL